MKLIKTVLEKLFYKEKPQPIPQEIKNSIKGTFGEVRQEFKLEYLPRENYKVINNIIIPNRQATSQIDHLVISNYGIFVIENKNYSGNIYGSEYDKTWTQVMGKYKNKFYNPLLQNYGHIKAIEEIIGINKHIYSVVVFSDRAILRKVEITNQRNIKVINEIDLLNLIKEYKEIVLTNSQVNEIRDKIFESMATVSQSNISHVKNITTQLDSDFCPRCGGKLVNRKGQYGDFLGCSNFPKCKYTKKL